MKRERKDDDRDDDDYDRKIRGKDDWVEKERRLDVRKREKRAKKEGSR